MTEAEWFDSDDVDTMLAFVADHDPPPGAVCPAVWLSARKVRLFLVACCRRHWGLFEYPECRRALEVAERYADGLADDAERKVACQAAEELRTRAVIGRDEFAGPENRRRMIVTVLAADAAMLASWETGQLIRQHQRYPGIQFRPRPKPPPPVHPRDRHLVADDCPHKVGWAASEQAGGEVHSPTLAERAAQAHLLRCVTGDPFRGVAFDPDWQTPDVLSLAKAAYDQRAMPSGELDAIRLAVLADALEDAGGAGVVVEHLRWKGPHVRGCWAVDLVRSVD